MASSSNNLNNSVVSSNDNAQEKDTQSLLPHLESLERMMNLPVVGAAWQQSQDVYGKVKGNNRLFNWALSTAEDCVTRAVTITSPIVSKFDRPIQYVDQTLVKGIDKLEVKAPIIKDTPTEIYNQAKTKVIDAVHPHIEKVVKLKSAGQQKASSLKDLAWQKANEVLATQYGSLAVNGVDSTTALAERLLEYYFPNKGNDVEEENDKKQVAIMNARNLKANDMQLLLGASALFISLSVRIINELVEFVAQNPRIMHEIEREIENMCQYPPMRTRYYTQSRQSAAYPTRFPAASIAQSPRKSSI
ncbi:lipid storage droplets surface-binding protein 2 isoform X2 [Episyrphus balteatus]|uniref:lipid storage droplets surface-binding protein 2 isoform X2 n=1 Tax=Episyrphus balteatus TaxID=286459 RepID=UPI002484E9C4|nr:lipid storage droplets surface-binding protein 2 isoform X2 [Episyrphus balteatus]